MRITISTLALILGAYASPSIAAPVTATEAVQTKRLSLETNRQRQMYRAKAFQDVKAIYENYDYKQTGQNSNERNAQVYTTPPPAPNVQGPAPAPVSPTYSAAVNSLNIEFNARSSNDLRAIENYRSQEHGAIASSLQMMQNYISNMQQAQATQQAEARATYEELKANLTASMNNETVDYANALALLNTQFAATYAAIAANYGPAINSYKTAMQNMLHEAQSRIDTYANDLNTSRNAEYQSRLQQLQNGGINGQN
jgi:hypothetical protein